MKLKVPNFEIEIDKEDKKFLTKIAGNDFLGILGDWLSYFRWKNTLVILRKVKETCIDKEIDPMKVAPKFLSKFLEASSLEDNNDIQKIWANLLTEEIKVGNIDSYFIDIVKSLNSLDVRLLTLIHNNINRENIDSDINGNIVRDLFSEVDEEDFDSCIVKLYSLGILKASKMSNLTVGENLSPLLDTTRVFKFTSLGKRLCSITIVK